MSNIQERLEALKKAKLENDPDKMVAPIDIIEKYVVAPSLAAFYAQATDQDPDAAFAKQFGEDPKKAPRLDDILYESGITNPYIGAGLATAIRAVAPGAAFKKGAQVVKLLQNPGKVASRFGKLKDMFKGDARDNLSKVPNISPEEFAAKNRDALAKLYNVPLKEYDEAIKLGRHPGRKYIDDTPSSPITISDDIASTLDDTAVISPRSLDNTAVISPRSLDDFDKTEKLSELFRKIK